MFCEREGEKGMGGVWCFVRERERRGETGGQQFYINN